MEALTAKKQQKTVSDDHCQLEKLRYMKENQFHVSFHKKPAMPVVLR